MLPISAGEAVKYLNSSTSSTTLIKQEQSVFIKELIELSKYPYFYSTFSSSLSKQTISLKCSEDVRRSVFIERAEKIASVCKLYILTNAAEIRRFLRINDYLIEFLFKAPECISKIFGPDIKIYLEVHHDPEEEFDELFVIIKSPYPAKKARELMRQLRRGWFLDIIDKVQGKLNITEEPL